MKRAKIVATDEGDKYWIVGSHLNFKVSKEETEGTGGGTFSMGTAWVAPGGGPPPHVHRKEDEMFYILEGEVVVMKGKKMTKARSGGAVFLRRGEVHTFQVAGSEPALFLTLAMPGNFPAFVAEAGERIERIPCDLQVTPKAIEKVLGVAGNHDMEIMMGHRPEGAAGELGTGVAKWVMGELVTVKLTGADTDGKFCVAEVQSFPGGGVPVHFHRAMDEMFYVVEGEYEFVLDGTARRVAAGGTVYIPRGVKHGFKNVGAGKGRLADFHTPAGFEGFFEECGVACDDPEKRVMMVPEGERFAKILEKYGMVMA
ncbi:MAG TPA: cupin domain-containing protein [Phycisphaerae bacterium]|nr:cupin domain-containing protein [Phycisphaerae bacterium]